MMGRLEKHTEKPQKPVFKLFTVNILGKIIFNNTRQSRKNTKYKKLTKNKFEV